MGNQRNHLGSQTTRVLENKFESKIQLFNQFLILCVFTSLLGLMLTGCGQQGSVIGEPKKTQKQSASSIPVLQTQPPADPQPLPPEKTPQTKKITKVIHVSETNKADIIFVIDNSPSMRFEQANMAERFSSLLEEMRGLDWRLGIITTDVSHDQEKKDGRFLEFVGMPGVTHLSSEMDQEIVKAVFGATIQRPSREGNPNEQGIKATYRALERKPEWLRTDSSLNVVVVTDADETPVRGHAEIRNNPNDLLKYVKAEFPGKPFFFHSIIVKEGDSVCLKKDDNESYGRSYAWLSLKTGGVVGDVCQNDYSNQLKLIGEKVSQQIKSVHLDCEPLKNSVVVKAGELEIVDFVVEGAELKFLNPLPSGDTLLQYECSL